MVHFEIRMRYSLLCHQRFLPLIPLALYEDGDRSSFVRKGLSAASKSVPSSGTWPKESCTDLMGVGEAIEEMLGQLRLRLQVIGINTLSSS